MKINKNSLVLAAAFTGLLGGTIARLNAAPANGSSPSAVLRLPTSMVAPRLSAPGWRISFHCI